MPEDDKPPVQVTITVAGNHEDRIEVLKVVDALSATLDEPEIANTASSTMVTKIKKNGG